MEGLAVKRVGFGMRGLESVRGWITGHTRVVWFGINLLLAFFWLTLFQNLGWIFFRSVWWVVVVVVITKTLERLVDEVFPIVVFLTCGVGCLLLPLVMLVQGWLWLWILGGVTGWYTVNVDFFWAGFCMYTAYGLCRIPAVT